MLYYFRLHNSRCGYTIRFVPLFANLQKGARQKKEEKRHTHTFSINLVVIFNISKARNFNILILLTF
jgi:hypothetical protein